MSLAPRHGFHFSKLRCFRPHGVAQTGALLGAISSVVRWKILGELSLGEPQEIAELATVAGCSYDATIKHLAVLLKAGLVLRGRGRLFQIDKQFLASPGERVLDFGHCLLRFDGAK